MQVAAEYTTKIGSCVTFGRDVVIYPFDRHRIIGQDGDKHISEGEITDNSLAYCRMKIGVITFAHSKDNYGQILQCWALQQQLKRMGHEPYLIQYNPWGHRKKTIIPNRKNTKFKYLLLFPILKRISHYYKKWKRNREEKARDFLNFKKSYIICDEKEYHTIEDLRNDPPCADVYITGSDQVFGPLVDEPMSSGFYLSFGGETTKRISFAASFGRDAYPEVLKPHLRHLLKRFSAVSVREKSGERICSDIGITAIKVLDPTLLLSQHDYKTRIIGPAQISPKTKRFIYVYSINVTDKEDLQWSLLKEYANRNTYELLVTVSSGYFRGHKLYDGCKYENASIPKWLYNIQKARCVVTTSFHGVVFAIIFHKQFIYFPLKGQYSIGNSRALDLLSEVGLEQLIWQENCSFEQMMEIGIDWANVERNLYKRRTDSINFLYNNLS